MTLEYEVHNFDTNTRPRRYEAVYQAGDALIVKAVVAQRAVKGHGKPTFRWHAVAVAWTPGQAESDWTQLAHLEPGEITARDIVDHEATEETWLSAAQYDAQKLIDRSRPFADVLMKAAAAQGGKRRMKAAA